MTIFLFFQILIFNLLKKILFPLFKYVIILKIFPRTDLYYKNCTLAGVDSF